MGFGGCYHSVRCNNNNNDIDDKPSENRKCKKVRRLWGRYVCIRLVNPHERGMRTHDLRNGLGIVLAMTIVAIIWRVPFGLRIHVASIQLTTIRCLPSGMEWIRSRVPGPHRSYVWYDLRGSYPPVLHPNSKSKSVRRHFRSAVRGWEKTIQNNKALRLGKPGHVQAPVIREITGQSVLWGI